MPRFFTTNGDDGFTGLLGEGRVAKYSSRLEAVGEIDEDRVRSRLVPPGPRVRAA